MNRNAAPDMSVLMVTLDSFDRIRKTLSHLQKQTVQDRLEIVIMTSSIERLNLDTAELAGFFRYKIVEVKPMLSAGNALAAGVRQASAPIVAYAEEHSYPFPGWAEALIQAHRQPWAAIGATASNGNPASLISWTHLFTSFGPAVDATQASITNRLPWHQTSYKRILLLEYDEPELEAMLETEGILHQSLQRKGHQLYLEPAARVSHVNVSTLSAMIRVDFTSGRLYGARRAQWEQWSVFHRLLYFFGGPLIPLTRVRRSIDHIRQTKHSRKLYPRILPLLILDLIVHAAGEMTGYAFGYGNSVQRRMSFELDRCSYVSQQDKRAGVC